MNIDEKTDQASFRAYWATSRAACWGTDWDTHQATHQGADRATWDATTDNLDAKIERLCEENPADL